MNSDCWCGYNALDVSELRRTKLIISVALSDVPELSLGLYFVFDGNQLAGFFHNIKT